jgi:hypothetical protein
VRGWFDLPDGQITSRVLIPSQSPSPGAKKTAFTVGQISFMAFRVSGPKRGAYRDRHDT